MALKRAEVEMGPKTRDAMMLFFEEAKRKYPGRDVHMAVSEDGIGLAVGSLVLTLEASNG